MGMPGWAFGLGALLKGPEYINTGLDLYRGIRDDRANQANNQAARDTVDNLAWAAQEEDPAIRLENFREVSRDMTGRPVNADTALKLQKEIDAQSKGTLADVKTAQAQSQLEQFQKDAAASGKDLVTFAMENPAKIPLAALQGANSVFSTLATVTEKEAERRNKEQKEQEKQGNVSAFQSAIAGITAPSQSPTGLKRFAVNGGYAPYSEVEGDIRAAAVDYPVPAEVVNKEVDNARQTYKDTFLPTESGKVGRTSFTGQRNLLGDFRKDAQSTAPVIKVNIPNPRADRKDEFALRKEFLGLPEVKEYPTIETNSRRAAAALKETGSKLAVDQSLITVFNKMIDPTSVVRESEYARTPQDMAVLSRIKGKWGKVQEGGAGLDANERLALARMITNFSTIASRQYNARAGEYKQLAKEYGFEPGRVVARRNDLDEGGKKAPAITPQQAAAELARRRAKK